MRLPGSILLSQHGKRLRMRSEKRVVKRTVSNLFVKLKSMESEIADLRLKLKSCFGFSKARVIDPKNILNLEKGFNLDPIWSGFNESFREIMSKKVQK